ncbi:XRE family transcriptional regulator [Lactonifactor longoviformis]|uniref:Transcriptional regulator, contains XRE-family HTH domain n=1 Tax=Lactonifactor longoviformis DSM 17459 TaxID=1122155 RepID=A0A1M4WW65_9CLOT|nr:helix-turn-helix domain-containing protein [Lactonifactor longoviformis]POP33560.1 XRE family transcriptional regulator [Lactonifactor longoviformis]SHE85479.1 Transcriptional regulator, contains XRE-family HTH domain [Lactonifactor longoviformis DSM 17459]
MNLYERVKSLCKEYQITIAGLERICGFGNGTIKKWEHTIPSGDRLARVADHFHVTVDSLLGREPLLSGEKDSELLEMARELKENPDMKQLLELARHSSPAHLKAYVSFLKELQKKE